MELQKILTKSKMIDCSHTIEPTSFTMVSCFPGAETVTYKDADPCLKCGDTSDKPFPTGQFKSVSMVDTRKEDGSGY